MKLGTIVKIPDGRVGTICYHNLDGDGGVWGVHDFSHVDIVSTGGFTDDLPAPEFMLRDKKIEPLLRASRHIGTVECVGEDYEIVDEEEGGGE